MNKQIFVPRGDKSKKIRKIEYKEQLTDPRKPCSWKKLKWTCKSRKNEIDTFFLPGIRNWHFSNKKANVAVPWEKMQLSATWSPVQVFRNRRQICPQSFCVSLYHYHCNSTTQALQWVIHRHLSLLFIDIHSDFVQTNFSCTWISSNCQQHLQNSNADDWFLKTQKCIFLWLLSSIHTRD